MADTVTTRLLFDGLRRKIYNFNCVSDGTGESGVTKVDISTLLFKDGKTVPTYTAVDLIDFNIQGFTSVRVYWDHAVDDPIAILPAGTGTLDWNALGGKPDPRSTGGNGNILFTSAGATSGATYEITMYLRPKV